ncbi:topology modulation protein [Marinactinospora thermotolerans]|nr:topology modulation protein [Marinactinospora thermotolerans]
MDQRIVIIGCGGSGKTTLANRLAVGFGIPVTHLDAVYYDDEWNPLPQEEFAAVQEELVADPEWVIDGNYASTLPIRLRRATTVVFLDLPPLPCLWGIAQRRWRHGGGQDGRTGVYNRITWDFIRYVWNYRTTMRPRVRALIAEHAPHVEVHVATSRRAADRLARRIITRLTD